MTEFLFVRHGKTPGNLKSNYVGGRTDEPLAPVGVEALGDRLAARPDLYTAQRLYISPMCRCRETASLLFPQLVPTAVEDFRECDFGAFENLSFRDLDGDPRYQTWVDGGCTGPIPEGEDPARFQARCQAAFRPLMAAAPAGRTALVVHGGTIMAILSAFAQPPLAYFDCQVKNGGGFLCRLEGDHLTVLERF